MPRNGWKQPPENPGFEAGEVHIWRLAIDSSHPPFEKLFACLSIEERDRALRFVFDKDRHSYVVRHAALRHILGLYLLATPAGLVFHRGTYGKPVLAGNRDHADLSFNLSSSCGFAMIAVVQGRGVGIDVERIRPAPEHMHIARRFFSGREVDYLREAPGGRSIERFFTVWSIKEACTKATGRGLALSLNQIEVIAACTTDDAVQVQVDQGSACCFSVQRLRPCDRYVA
ncbi:MAG: 4'-phosphopantetheinyl transferase superfamily protein, partial [Terriglobia bacterium]